MSEFFNIIAVFFFIIKLTDDFVDAKMVNFISRSKQHLSWDNRYCSKKCTFLYLTVIVIVICWFQEYYFVRTTEYALTLCKEYKVPLTRQKSEDFNICLVITNLSQNSVYQSETEKYTLKLQYFIVLTSQRDLFPVDFLEKKLGQFKSISQSDG